MKEDSIKLPNDNNFRLAEELQSPQKRITELKDYEDGEEDEYFIDDKENDGEEGIKGLLKSPTN